MSYFLFNILYHKKYSIVEVLTNLGKVLGAYKMTLDCKDSMKPFYESLGYGAEAGN